ncbi:YHS domain-containing (seleno)protein [Agaribacter flavus]|uniref:YHS domain-containing (Seleno)protein n=1 Tax=Agaribacter flavus TaxID=1902781 RepID=A0ABV7FM80_9ALTE
MPSKLITIFAVVIAFTVTSCGLIPSQAKSSIDAVNVDETRTAIKGYDPVAYFTESKPVQGDKQFSAEHNGAVYYFASAKHQSLFKGNPDKYAPQYGGYCAFGVSKEKKFDTDPTAWAIVDDKLYLNLNAKVQSRWVLNKEELISDANDIWTDIENTPASEL